MASGNNYESFHFSKPSLHFCKHIVMTPPKKDSYSLAVAARFQSAISASQIASAGHKICGQVTFLPR